MALTGATHTDPQVLLLVQSPGLMASMDQRGPRTGGGLSFPAVPAGMSAGREGGPLAVPLPSTDRFLTLA